MKRANIIMIIGLSWSLIIDILVETKQIGCLPIKGMNSHPTDSNNLNLLLQKYWWYNFNHEKGLYVDFANFEHELFCEHGPDAAVYF